LGLGRSRDQLHAAELKVEDLLHLRTRLCYPVDARDADILYAVGDVDRDLLGPEDPELDVWVSYRRAIAPVLTGDLVVGLLEYLDTLLAEVAVGYRQLQLLFARHSTTTLLEKRK
jgi:hypothetical protein